MEVATRRALRLLRHPFGRGLTANPPRVPLFALVAATAVGAAMILPLAYLLLRTLASGAELAEILLRPRTLEIALRSLLLVVAVTAASIVLAVPLAWLTVRTDLPGRRLWSILLVVPLVIPTYVGGFLVVVALGPKGMLQQLLEPLGVERLPEIYGFPGAFLTLTLFSFPYVLLPVRAALLRLDPALEEVSRSLGKGPWLTFRQVVLPQLRPAILAGARLVALYTLAEFGAVSILRYETFTWAIYVQYESAFDRTTAGALAMLLIGAAFLLLAVGFPGAEAAPYYRSTPGSTRPPALSALGWRRWPAVMVCGVIVTLALLVPMMVLVYWAVRGLQSGQGIPSLLLPAWNSVTVSALAAVTTVMAALPLAVLSARYPSPVTRGLERLSHLGFALPAITIALALVFFAANFTPSVYQTRGLLIFAYVMLFLPTAVGSIRASLLQVSPQLEELARSLGRKPWQVFASVTLPLIRPGLLAGAGMVFLLTMKELPATVILSPPGFPTLATSVWAAVTEAFFARAAVPALVLILVSSLSLAFMLRREGGYDA